jgi:hypothetical protein
MRTPKWFRLAMRPFAQMTIDAAFKGPPFRREEALRRERWRATDLRLARKNRTLAGNSKHGDGGAVTSSRRKELKPWSPASTTPKQLKCARLDDRLGLWAVTYLLFFVKLGPRLALFLVLIFAIWIGWRWLCRKCPAVAWAVWWRVMRRTAPAPPNRAPSIHLLPLRGRS